MGLAMDTHAGLAAGPGIDRKTVETAPPRLCAVFAWKTPQEADCAAPRLDSAEWLADAAVAALVDEATLTPKPGLVDFAGPGAHDDLDWGLMCRSARALRPAFADMARAARDTAGMAELRQAIGHIGRQGEAAMLRATGGVNTHRGAIWALGLLVTAAARDPARAAPAEAAARAGALARLADPGAPARTGHKGEAARLRYGVGGARGQAQAGFPHVVGQALPWLYRSRRAGDPEDAARLNALLAVMAGLDDTCVLSRGGWPALAALQRGAGAILAHGGAAGEAGRARLRSLARWAASNHISPGGAADLLAAALFLDRLQGGPGHGVHFI